MADLTIKQGDTAPALSVVITDASGAVVNLTGATVSFVMRAMTATATTTNVAPTVTNAATGAVTWTPTATDTANAGRFMAEFKVTTSGGTKLTYPTDGYLEIVVEENLSTPGGARLLGLGEVKDHLRFTDASRSRDARLVEMIDAVAPVVEGIAGPILQRVVSETYDGGGWFLSLRRRPVVEVHSVAEYRGPIKYELTQVPTPDLGTIYSYMFEPPGRIVRRTVGGGVTPFPPGADAVFVTYTSGFAKVPANVREATLELIRVNFQQSEQGGRPSFGSAGYGGGDEVDGGHVMLGFYVPNRVRELLAPSRRHPSIA